MKTFNLMIASFLLAAFTVSLGFFDPIEYQTLLIIYGSIFGLATLYFADINTPELLTKIQTDIEVLDVGFLYISKYSTNNNELWYTFDFRAIKDIPTYKDESAVLNIIKSYMHLDLEFVQEFSGVRYFKSKV